MKKLNLGCGRRILDGYINLDKVPLGGVDTVCDVEKSPLPFEDNYFDEILCETVLEHIDYVHALKEIHRVMKVGGRMIITIPHFTATCNFLDPTHKHSFSVRTFDCFIKGDPHEYYFDFAFNKVITARILFSKRLPYNWPLEFFVNLHPLLQKGYEATGLSRLFPAHLVYLIIEK